MTKTTSSLTFSDRGDFSLADLLEAQMLDDRTLCLLGEIIEYSADELTHRFYALAKAPEPITLLITSPGGQVDAGNAIVRAIRSAQLAGCQVIGEVRGYALSMAAFILQSCDLRYAAPEDVIMIHGVTGGMIGDIRNQEADVQLAKRFMEQQARFLSERNTSDDTQLSNFAFWSELLKDNLPHYYFGQEALDAGLIDALIGV